MLFIIVKFKEYMYLKLFDENENDTDIDIDTDEMNHMIGSIEVR